MGCSCRVLMLGAGAKAQEGGRDSIIISMLESDETSLERLSLWGSGEKILARLSLSSDYYTSQVTLKLPTLKAMAEKVVPRFMVLLLAKLLNDYNIP